MVGQLKRKVSWGIIGLLLLLLNSGLSVAARTMPDELYEGWARFQVESGRYLDALVIMDEVYQNDQAVTYAAALKGFNLAATLAPVLEALSPNKAELSPYEWFTLGKVFYHSDECIPALKSFKRLKNRLSLEDKQEWAFYRANCFIKLGSDTRAAQVLSDILSGQWISHAYYNLAMSYAAGSTSKTKALVALRVASSLNQSTTLVERELNDRVNYAAGSLLLGEGQPDRAIEFFKNVHLDSMIAPQALYLNGVAQLEINDFRSATQSWYAVKKHALIKQGVAESLLAIPYAYERGGYVSQAIESYVEASDYFEKELDTIAKISSLLPKHGFRQVLIEEDGLEGLEWFLTKDVARNTIRAAYYTYLVEDQEIYGQVELMEELGLLQDSLKYWKTQLEVFAKSLGAKKKSFSALSRGFDVKAYQRRIRQLTGEYKALDVPVRQKPGMQESLGWQRIADSVQSLDARLSKLLKAKEQGKEALAAKLKKVKALQDSVGQKERALSSLIKDVDKNLVALSSQRLEKLRKDTLGHFERSEQGLIHILQTIAESKQARTNRLDGRYQ